MKKFLSLLTMFMVLLYVGCSQCETDKPDQDSTKAVNEVEKPKVVKHYTVEQFFNTIRINGRSFTHDESKILYSSDKTGIMNIYAQPLAGGEPEQLTASTKESYFLLSAFPEDGRILFTADQGGNEILHLYVREEDGTVKDITPEPKARASFSGWSRDLKTLYFTSNKRDPKFSDLYEMDVKTYESKLIYKNDQGFAEMDIANDKRYIALSKTDTDSNSDIYLYDMKTKKTKHITPHEGNINHGFNNFSMDSRTLHFLCDENSEFIYLKSYDLETGKIETVLQRDWDISFVGYSWNERYQVIGINKDARTVLEIMDLKENKPVSIPGLPEGDISGLGFSRSEKYIAFYLGSSRIPRDLFFYDIAAGTFKQLTQSLNPEIDKNDLVEAEVIRYKSFDGVEIPAIYYKPLNIKTGEKVPGLVWVHGGPGGQSRIGYSNDLQYLVNHGYAVLAVNNRGSSGYGKSFYKMDDRKHGEGDLMDCVYAKQFFKSTGYVDETRIGIMGGSYGGYMVLAALVYQPEEFAVGVDLFGVSNWVRTLTSIPTWWESFRKALYEEMGNPETDLEYLKKISPLFHADKITKPLMVLQGANDPRVLKVESDEIVEAVKKKGIPVEYVIFEDEGHGFIKKSNNIKANKAVLEFLDKYLKGKAETYVY